MTDKTTPEGFSKAKVTPEGFSKRKATEDDVEGHSLSRRRDADGEGFNRAKVTAEGFARARKATKTTSRAIPEPPARRRW